jgi:electron transport complex protein RnfB
VTAALPGSNCGGCGYAGCSGYAEAVLKVASVPANLCVVGGAKTVQAVSELTGKAAGATEPRMSFRRCAKGEGVMKQRFAYSGVASCSAAAQTDGGSDACAYSCLGLGDCQRVCPFDAIVIKEGAATIVVERCVACGKCITACPRKVLQLVPLEHRVMIFCGTHNKAKTAMDSCSVGCINCNACIRKCPAKAIANPDGRIEIDHEKCMAHGPDCAEVCVDACARGILRATCPETIERKLREKREAAAKKAAAKAVADAAAKTAEA